MFNKFADRVAADNARESKRHRGSAGWLQKAAYFDHNILLSSEKRRISVRLFNDLMQGKQVYKRTQKELDFELLCANLLENRLRRPVAVSRNRKDWTRNRRYRRASYFVIEVVAMLLQNGLIELEKGYGHKIHDRARRTKIWPTEKLLDAFKPIRMEDCVFEPVDLVNLRDKDKKPIDYRDTRETQRVREVLRRVNTVTDRALVQYVDPRSRMAYRLETRLVCIYNVDFKHGGRFYTRDKDGYQGLNERKRKERSCIHIDGEPTVELDFEGMHVRLLYAWEGIHYDGDPYTAVVGDAELRPIIKELLLILVNAEDEGSAVRAGNKLLFDDRKYYRRLHRRGLKVKADLIPMFKTAHARISKYFCSGSGLKAQNTDAKIALRVMEHFANDNIPILAVHDSFIVQKQYSHRLHKVMTMAYRDVTGGFRCPVRAKSNHMSELTAIRINTDEMPGEVNRLN